SIVSWIIKKRIHHIELFINYPVEVQEDLRESLVHKAKNTEFGRIYDFNSIKNAKDFSNRIPLNDYTALEPFIKKMRSGERNVLWPSEVKWFAKSSGTTSDKSKYIPVSKESIEDCHYKGGKDLLSVYCNNFSVKNIFEGKSLMLGGSHEISSLSESMYEGDLSAIILENLPFWVQLQQSPDKEIALMSEWEKKIDLMADQAINENITSLSGVPSWALVFANKVLEKTGKSHLHELWPNFELYMHGGVNFKPYKSSFEALFPKGINYLETYNASEGFFGIQDDPDRQDMLLMLDYGIYYEFVPLEEIDKDQPMSLTLSEVETHKDYALVITTNGGLWRYLIGDTIRFSQLHPFRFVISGRTKHFINAFGEELMIHNAEHALEVACAHTKTEILDYTAAPKHISEGQKAYHEWLIEFKSPPEDLDLFSASFDTALKSVNSDYEAKRYKNMILEAPKIQIATKGLFFKWMKKRGKLGGQNKVPRLSDERKFIDELLQMNS
ncbi:MAG: GH3 auxin-responsive promoter family protein, partial [Flavobacteriales bacterium]|nr:GH3 auxin-responsive promoter family protein [Flavobacteriales bacterium]